MASITARFRLTVYAPDGVTILQPRAGSAHSAPFQVTTERGAAAPWQPYMMAPEGRRGRFDRLSCNAELGEIIVPLLDKRVSTNATRWVSAFAGDDSGRVQLKGLTAFIERSIDGGAWAPYYHGRITHISAPEPTKAGPVIRISVLDHRVDEFRNVFTGAPHRAITYAKPARLWPCGLPEMENGKGWAGFPATPAAYGLIAWDDPGDESVLLLTSASPSNVVNREQHNFRVTEALAKALDGSQNAGPRVALPAGRPATRGSARLWMKRRDTDAEGWFLLRHVFRPQQTGYNGGHISVAFLSGNGNLLEVGIAPLPVDHPQYMAVPPAGTEIDYEIYHTGEPTPDAPLMIHDVHPVTFWRDLYAGYFGDLAWDMIDGVKDAAGVLIAKGERVRTPIPIDAASFAALEADDSLDHVTMQVTSSSDLGEFLRDHLFAAVHVAAQVRGDAKIYAADLRIPSSTAGLPLLTRAEYISADWDAGDDAKTAIVVRYPRFWEDSTATDVLSKDPREFPRIAVTRLAGREERDVSLTDLYALMPVAEHAVSGAAFPATPVPRFFPVRESPERYKRAARPYVSLYGTGAQYLDLRTRFVAGLTDDIWPLEWIRVNVPPPPNPSNNLRGGERVFLVLQREDAKDGTIRFRLLDAGPDAIAVAPSFGDVALSVTTPEHGIFVELSVNASDELAEIDYVVTEASVGVRPADTDPGWRLALQTGIDVATSIERLPSGKRVWLRARSIPAGKIASSYVYAASIDTTALSPPTGLSTTVSGRSIALSWTNAESAYRIMPLQALAPGPAIPYLRAPLPAASTRMVFEELEAGSHVLGVRYVDEFGGTSSDATVTVSTAAPMELAAPRRVWFVQSASAPVGAGVPTPEGSPGTGVQVAIERAALYSYAHVQLATDSAFANIVADITLPPGDSDTLIITPLDGALRYLRVREERDGYIESDWSATISAYPTILTRAPIDAGNFVTALALEWVPIAHPSFPNGAVQLRLSGEVGPRTQELKIQNVVHDPPTADSTWLTNLDCRDLPGRYFSLILLVNDPGANDDIRSATSASGEWIATVRPWTEYDGAVGSLNGSGSPGEDKFRSIGPPVESGSTGGRWEHIAVFSADRTRIGSGLEIVAGLDGVPELRNTAASTLPAYDATDIGSFLTIVDDGAGNPDLAWAAADSGTIDWTEGYATYDPRYARTAATETIAAAWTFTVPPTFSASTPVLTQSVTSTVSARTVRELQNSGSGRYREQVSTGMASYVAQRSSDGAAWSDVFSINLTTGAVDFAGALSVGSVTVALVGHTHAMTSITGELPASRVSAGTFGAGNYVITGDLSAAHFNADSDGLSGLRFRTAAGVIQWYLHAGLGTSIALARFAGGINQGNVLAISQTTGVITLSADVFAAGNVTVVGSISANGYIGITTADLPSTVVTIGSGTVNALLVSTGSSVIERIEVPLSDGTRFLKATTTDLSTVYFWTEAALSGSLSAGDGLTGSPFDGTGNRTWTANTWNPGVNLDPGFGRTTIKDGGIAAVLGTAFDMAAPGNHVHTMSQISGDLPFARVISPPWIDDANTSAGISVVRVGNTITIGLTSHTHTASEITSGVFLTARIPDLDAAKITSGAFADARIPGLAASKITSGTFANARIAVANVTQHQASLIISAAQVTSGTFTVSRIPNLPASQITTGTFAQGRISETSVTQHAAALSINMTQVSGDLAASRISPGAFSGDYTIIGALTFSGAPDTASSSIYRNATNGVSIRGYAGIARSFVLLNEANLLVMSNPVGTQNAEFGGHVTLTSGRFLAPDGTAPVPSYTFTSDSNTGMYLIANNVGGLCASGVEVLRFQQGLTTLYNGALEIRENTTGGSRRIRFELDTVAGKSIINSTYGTGGEYELSFQLANVERMALDDSGLTVNGTAHIANALTVGAGLNVSLSAVIGGALTVGGAATFQGSRVDVEGELYEQDARVAKIIISTAAPSGSHPHGTIWARYT